MTSFHATDPHLAHFWLCAAELVANGVCAPTLTAEQSMAQKRTAVAQHVGGLAKELLVTAVGTGELQVTAA